MATFSIILTIFIPKGRGYHFCGRIWSHIILKTIGISVEVKGLEKLNRSEEYVFISNHASAIDIPVIIASVPWQIRMVAKKELEKVPFLGWSLRLGDYILIDRKNSGESKKSIESAIHKIQNGRSVFMFVEGTRSKDGNILPFKKGPFVLAIQAQVSIVPITLNFTPNIMVKNSIKVRKGTVEVIFDDPIPTVGKTLESKDEILKLAYERVSANHQLKEVV